MYVSNVLAFAGPGANVAKQSISAVYFFARCKHTVEHTKCPLGMVLIYQGGRNGRNALHVAIGRTRMDVYYLGRHRQRTTAATSKQEKHTQKTRHPIAIRTNVGAACHRQWTLSPTQPRLERCQTVYNPSTEPVASARG